MLNQGYAVESVDFDCKHGVSWNTKKRQNPIGKGMSEKERRENTITPKKLLANFAESVAQITKRHRKDGVVFVDRETYVRRITACRACPEGLWDEEARFGAGKCNHPGCGCTKGKMLFAAMQCPLDPPEWESMG